MLSFVERLKYRRVKIFSDNQSAARALSFDVFKVHTVGGSKRFSCLFSHGIAWKRSGFLDRSTGTLIFCAVSLTRMIRQLIPVFLVVEAKWGPRTNLNRFTSCYRALSLRGLTPSLLLVVVGVSDAFVRDCPKFQVMA